MQKYYDRNSTARWMYLSPDSHWNKRFISLSQDESIKTNGLLDAPKISWASNGANDIEFTKQFYECISHVIEIAELWDKDTGKKITEVFGV